MVIKNLKKDNLVILQIKSSAENQLFRTRRA